MPMLLKCSRVRSTSALFLVLFCAGVIGCGNAGVSVKAAETNPETVIKAMLQAQQDAWNKSDPVAYSAVFSDDVDFINIRGQIFSGKTAVAELHAKIFSGPFKGSTVSIVGRSFRLLVPGVAVVDTDQTVTGYAGLPPGIVPTTPGTLITHFKYIALKQEDGNWAFSSGQNTSSLPN